MRPNDHFEKQVYCSLMIQAVAHDICVSPACESKKGVSYNDFRCYRREWSFCTSGDGMHNAYIRYNRWGSI
jgi:hypothetical protein